MKKLIIFLFIFTSIFLAFSPKVMASQYDHLPGGKNYISPNNLEYYTQGSFKTIDNILVKPETTYVISFDVHFFTQGFELEVIFFNNLDPIESVVFVEEDAGHTNIDNEHYSYFVFTTANDINYIEVDFVDTSAYEDQHLETVQLEEGTKPTAREAYIEGTVIDTTSPYFQNAGNVISYVDQPITTLEIQNSLVAYDSVDGDVSNNITLLNDGYTENIGVIGQYTITFSVSDSSGNESLVDILVDVVDVLPPVFGPTTDIEVIYPNTKTVEQIISQLSASDNYDGDVSTQIQVVSDEYTANASTIGDYPMQFKVSDGSGNESFKDIIVHVLDQEEPSIQGDSEIYISYSQYYSEPEIINAMSVSDNYDETVELIIENNAYKNNSQDIGTYSILLSATDSSGNRSEKVITINVVDEIPPVIYLDASVIQVYSDTVLALPDFVDLLKRTNELNSEMDYTYSVVYDHYSDYSRVPGVYHLKLKFKDNYGEEIDKEIEVRVLDKEIDGIVFGDKINQENIFVKHKEKFLLGGVGTLFLGSQAIWFFIYRKKKM